MPFEYEPLQKGQFRLLTLQVVGDSDDKDLPVHCKIETVDFPAGFMLDGPFKGHDFVWPEISDPVDTCPMFKDSPTGPKALYNNFLYTTSRKPENDRTKKISVLKDYILNEHTLPWRQLWGDYVTLSYTWGSPTPARHIVLNGNVFEVTPNLHEALLQLRSTQRIRQGFKLWIDAICINQSDDVEKEHQIPLMRQIYCSAWQVWTWTGVADEDSDLAIAALRYLAERSKLADPVEGFHEERKPKNNVPGATMWTVYKSPFRKEVHKAIYHLLTRSYWHRMWIIQEVAMSRDDSPIACGSAHISWKQLSDAASFIESDEERLGRYIFESVNPKMIPTWDFDFARARCIQEQELSPERLWSLLLEMALVQRDQKCTSITNSRNRLRPLLLGRLASVTNEKDRVYGILGINSIADTVNIIPDYTLSLSDIYKNFSTHLFSRGDLNLLRLVSRPTGEVAGGWKSDEIPAKLNTAWIAPFVGPVLQKTSFYTVVEACSHDLPTWAICWTCRPAPIVHLPGKYCASGDYRSIVPPMALSDSVLVVKGLLFDTIASLGAFHASEKDESYPKYTMGPSKNAYKSFEGLRDAFWRTVIAGTSKTGESAPESYSWLLEPMIWHQGVAGVHTNGFGLGNIMRRNQKLHLCGHTLEHIIRGVDAAKWGRKSLKRVYDPSKEQREALSWAMNVMAWRRLTSTAAGRIGLSPAGAILGDRIALIQGCDVPLVLRPHGCQDGLTVVGECYIHGVMNGELINGGWEWAEFKLY